MHYRLARRCAAGVLCVALLFAGVARTHAVAQPHASEPEGEAMSSTRPSVLAGSWYAGDPRELARSVDAHIAAGRPLDQVAGAPPILVIAPHAGHTWSGPTAGQIYRLISGEAGAGIRHVILLGPSHRMGFRGASVPEVAAYETPLGPVPLDRQAAATLRRHPLFDSIAAAHSQEHCLEIQLPFLQRALPEGFRILPILVSRLSSEQWREAAQALLPLFDEGTLVLISSDFTHYGAHFGYYPFHERVERNLRRLDRGALAPILNLDPRALAAYHAETGITVCGLQPIGIGLELLNLAAESGRWTDRPAGRVLDYTRSGDQTGDFDSSVSYAAVAFFPPGTLHPGDDYPPTLREVPVWGEAESAPHSDAEQGSARNAGDDEALLSRAQQAYLLSLARLTIRELVERQRIPDAPPLPEGVSERELRETCGVFVTLETQGRLRGCIGSIVGTRPLIEGVIENAVSAASRDPRFPPVRAEELDALSIEISVLTPLHRARGPEEIEIGRHGVVFSLGGQRAVFLPQVAPEQGWDRDTMLAHLARKAGLPADAWRDPQATFDLFEAFVFSESEAAG
ncbi:MAG: AmmeMemoRadiSam system protein B [Candidatus Eisenbacteria bacterium]|nr:AmmeMemoRadiSam system protein B [Candidatus Eisenbacteria bacterium]